jgi:hypothetical protein
MHLTVENLKEEAREKCAKITYKASSYIKTCSIIYDNKPFRMITFFLVGHWTVGTFNPITLHLGSYFLVHLVQSILSSSLPPMPAKLT